MNPRQRRRHGSGGVTQYHDDPSCPELVDGVRAPHRCRGRWAATFELPRGGDGKRRRRRVYGRSKAEALRKLREVIRREAPPTSG